MAVEIFYINKLNLVFRIIKREVERGDDKLIYKVDKVSKVDGGRYVCYGLQSNESSFLDRSIDVIVVGKKDVTSYVKEGATLTCALKGQGKLKWRRLDSVSK